MLSAASTTRSLRRLATAHAPSIPGPSRLTTTTTAEPLYSAPRNFATPRPNGGRASLVRLARRTPLLRVSPSTPTTSRSRPFSTSFPRPSTSTSANPSSSTPSSPCIPSTSPTSPPPSTSSSKVALSILHRPTSPIETRLPSDPPMHLTPTGADQLQSVYQREGNNEQLGLRVEVKPGGCHGFQYGMELTEEREEDDFIFQHPEKKGAKLVIDSTSLRLLQGSTIDYATELIGSQFVIRDNPQSKGAGCGCGVSWEPIVDL